MNAPNNANATQVGGRHYKDRAVQPWDFTAANDLGWFEGEIVKYVTRWRVKGGVDDLRKARHVLDKLIELHVQFNWPMDPIMPEHAEQLVRGLHAQPAEAETRVSVSAETNESGLRQLNDSREIATLLRNQLGDVLKSAQQSAPITDEQIQLQHSMLQACAMAKYAINAIDAAIEVVKEAPEHV